MLCLDEGERFQLFIRRRAPGRPREMRRRNGVEE
uniref:Uncharacterized protein n=1 Tax=Lepeophtheirus salmonis TaxID=72036 RepID=A0A0K2TLT9_LEPSM